MQGVADTVYGERTLSGRTYAIAYRFSRVSDLNVKKAGMYYIVLVISTIFVFIDTDILH